MIFYKIPFHIEYLIYFNMLLRTYHRYLTRFKNVRKYSTLLANKKKRANDLDIIILSEADQARETQIRGITSM